MGGGKSGHTLLFYFWYDFLLYLSRHYKVTSGMEIFYLVNNFQTSQSQHSTEIKKLRIKVNGDMIITIKYSEGFVPVTNWHFRKRRQIWKMTWIDIS